MAKYFGFNPPFLTRDAVLPPQSDERLIKNDLLQLLLTSPGERVMRPTFGTPLRTFPFEQLDQISLTALQTGIKQAIDQFEPRVQFKSLNVKTDPGQASVFITLFVSLTTNPNNILTVDLTLPLQSGASPKGG